MNSRGQQPPLSKHQRLWFFVLWLSSLLAWFVINILPSNALKYFLGTPLKNHDVSMICTDIERVKARKIGQMMISVSHRVPWSCECLSQVLCVSWLLKYYKIPFVVFLGAMVDDDKLRAHAWLCAGKAIIVGEKGHRPFKVVAAFTSSELLA